MNTSSVTSRITFGKANEFQSDLGKHYGLRFYKKQAPFQGGLESGLEDNYLPKFFSAASRSRSAFDAFRAPPPSSCNFTRCPREHRTVRCLAASSSVKRTLPPQFGQLVSTLSVIACFPFIKNYQRPLCSRPQTILHL